MKKLCVLLLLVLSASVSSAQSGLVGTVRGKVVSGDPNNELVQAAIHVEGSDPVIGTVTDETGSFSFKVPVGRQRLIVSSMGFLSQEIDVLVNTGKEVMMNVVLEPAFEELTGVEFVASRDKSRPINRLSVTGAIRTKIIFIFGTFLRYKYEPSMLRGCYNKITFLLSFQQLINERLILFFVNQNTFFVPHPPESGLVAIIVIDFIALSSQFVPNTPCAVFFPVFVLSFRYELSGNVIFAP
jgi:hypothetical protein